MPHTVNLETKQQLIDALMSGKKVHFSDHSIFAPRHFISTTMKEGDQLVCSGTPEGRWFAFVRRTASGWEVK